MTVYVVMCITCGIGGLPYIKVFADCTKAFDYRDKMAGKGPSGWYVVTRELEVHDAQG